MAPLLFHGADARASADVQRARMAVCEACDRFRKWSRTCAVCNCFMPAKTRLAVASCPLSKWPGQSGAAHPAAATMKYPAATFFQHAGSDMTLYRFADAGDELPMHEHTFAHLSIAIEGSFHAFDGEGRDLDFEAPAAVLFEHGRKHCIRAHTGGAVLLNVQHIGPGATTRHFDPVRDVSVLPQALPPPITF